MTLHLLLRVRYLRKLFFYRFYSLISIEVLVKCLQTQGESANLLEKNLRVALPEGDFWEGGGHFSSRGFGPN
jgi:hypothetical protein